MGTNVQGIIEKYGSDRARLMDILIDIQNDAGFISDEATTQIAEALNISEADVVQDRSFYHFFTDTYVGDYAIYLNNSAASEMRGCDAIAEEFEKGLGCKFGEVTEDGRFGLHYTACIGMSDQEPAALINGQVFTKLSRSQVIRLVADMKAGKSISDIVKIYGDGNNGHPLVKSMVQNNIRKRGDVILSGYEVGSALKHAVKIGPRTIIDELRVSNLRGRGGAGFPTGLKWDFCSKNEGEKVVICNADEGEPGTFKDRVLLTETPKTIFEGMALGGFAIGAKEGIIYLRGEYSYLRAFLENALDEMRKDGLLGSNICGKDGFDFDIRIQMGAGAYVCGEESALIESAEGKRGEPRNRPPFPVQVGYKNRPTIVNNVETYCAATRIVIKGGEWYQEMGTEESAGTKLLSISGDCQYPGIYEIEWGMTINEMLEMVGAENVQAVQVAGPSGICLNPAQFERQISFEDLPTGGSMLVIGKQRDLLMIVKNYMEFFMDESCGSCVPCRTMNKLLKQRVVKVIEGKATKKDLDDMLSWGNVIKNATRCGLGMSSANPVVTSILNFRELYESKLVEVDENFKVFDMDAAVRDSCSYVGRPPVFHEEI